MWLNIKKAQRIKWCGHFKYKTGWNRIGRSTKGRPKYRWRCEVISDLKKLKQRRWMQLVEDRKAWNDLVQKSKTHVGL